MPVTDGLYYSEHKSGQVDRPVVLLHGAGSSHLVWPPLMRRLPGWTILALDLPGHGRSAGPGCSSVADYSARVVSFLAEKRVYQVVLVGHSLGGAIALQLALDHPFLVRGLGLISTGAHHSLPKGMQINQDNPQSLEDALQLFKTLAFSPSTPTVTIDRLFRPLLHVPQSILAGDWQAGAGFDVRARLESLRLRIPTWLAVGADDRLTPRSSANFLKSFLPGAHLQVIPRAGHFLPLEQPAALSQGFYTFLSRLTSQ